MNLDELYFYSYQINKIQKFGFNYGRRMNQRQLNKMVLIEYGSASITYKVSKIRKLLPSSEDKYNLQKTIKYKNHSINTFFIVIKGKGDCCFLSLKQRSTRLVKLMTITWVPWIKVNKNFLNITILCDNLIPYISGNIMTLLDC